jgi:hypothetical protein
MANPSIEGQRHTESQSGSSFKQGTSEAVQAAKEAAREAGRGVVGQAQQAASTAYQKASDTVSAAGKRADSALSAAASGMHSIADTIREKASSEGMTGAASRAVSESIDSGARYLENEGISGIGRDLTDLIRRNPFPAVIAGLCLGYWLGRANSRR